MAAMILNSPRAIQMSVYVVRAFVGLRKSVCRTSTIPFDYPADIISQEPA
jgi:hypothetical protein